MEIGSEKHDFGIDFQGFNMHGGFGVWLLNGCGPNLCFPKAFGQSTRFPRQKSGDMSPYFHGGNYAWLAIGDMNCDNQTERGE